MTWLIRRGRRKEANDAAVPERSSVNQVPLAPPEYSFLLPPVEPDEIGRLGTYRILRLLGRGGMGFVFHAEDITLRRAVALKVMKPDLDGDMRGWERFLREARVMAAIKHESLVTVFQAGQEGSALYLAMELLEGVSLQDWCVRSFRPHLTEILRLGREIAAGLAAIHRHGLVHRDIKPANLWLEAPANRV
ncbi:MAG TPA: serine/threonine-protein kinase, partial [Gemmataceae bacterium]|nr:serine/threonine-protein kinase [Gemmataceae bacterium]